MARLRLQLAPSSAAQLPHHAAADAWERIPSRPPSNVSRRDKQRSRHLLPAPCCPLPSIGHVANCLVLAMATLDMLARRGTTGIAKHLSAKLVWLHLPVDYTALQPLSPTEQGTNACRMGHCGVWTDGGRELGWTRNAPDAADADLLVQFFTQRGQIQPGGPPGHV